MKRAAKPSDEQRRFATTTPAPSLVLAVSYAVARRGLPSARSFRRWALAALTAVGRRAPAELSIRIVGAREGRAMNRRWRGRDYATNVLSFAADLPRGVPVPLLGDLVIAAPVVAREARQQGKPLAHHYAHLTVHGVLHLLGHDHENERHAERMETIERRVLAALDMPDPYAEEA